MPPKTTVISILAFFGIAVAIHLFYPGKSNESGNNNIHNIHMPVEGIWKVMRSPGHDTFAFDLAKIDKTSHKKLTGTRFQHLLGNLIAEDWHSWNEVVFSPADGVVVESHDSEADRKHQSLLRDLWGMLSSRPDVKSEGLRPFAGNYIIIQANGFYVFLAHLKQHSLTVSTGDTVRTGQPLARVGNSGMTLEPHLHFQLFDQIDNIQSANAPPFTVSKFDRWSGSKWEKSEQVSFQKGDIIRFSKNRLSGQ